MPYFLREKRLSGLFYLYTYTSQQHFEITNSLKDKCMRQNLRFKDHFRCQRKCGGALFHIYMQSLSSDPTSVDVLCRYTSFCCGPLHWTNHRILHHNIFQSSLCSYNCVYYNAILMLNYIQLLNSLTINNLYFYWYQLSNSCFRSNNHFILCWLLKIDDI